MAFVSPIALRSAGSYHYLRHLALTPNTSQFSFLRPPPARRVALTTLTSSSQTDFKQMPEDKWRSTLTPEQFRVLRLKGTEWPGSGEYNKFYPKDGTFTCVACEAPLYTAKSKFDSGCGWPAFYEGVEGAILERPDADGMRVEVLCANCGGHLGHVFRNEGFDNPTNERHCVNSVCLAYKKEA